MEDTLKSLVSIIECNNSIHNRVNEQYNASLVDQINSVRAQCDVKDQQIKAYSHKISDLLSAVRNLNQSVKDQAEDIRNLNQTVKDQAEIIEDLSKKHLTAVESFQLKLDNVNQVTFVVDREEVNDLNTSDEEEDEDENIAD